MHRSARAGWLSRLWLVWLACASMVGIEPVARAQPKPADDALATAKTQFREGVTLFNAGDFDRALDAFLRSREAFASPQNTIDAALCLTRLGRDDEALEMYEQALTRFHEELKEADRVTVVAAMADLRGRVASVDVSANVDGTVVIDGRPRSKLPLHGPIRVLRGRHTLRVLKDGYATHEEVFTIEPGKTLQIDALLKPLAAAGQLRIETPGADGAEVFIDRVSVGVSPWEGTLAPGPHVVWTEAHDVGSTPVPVTLLQGQTALVRARMEALGGVLRITTSPVTAEVSLDGVLLGAGAWSARVRPGDHVVGVVEPGYFAKEIRVAVGPAGGTTTVDGRLIIDPNDPRWPKARVTPPFANPWIGAFGSIGFGTGLGGDADSTCSGRCSGFPGSVGYLGGVRAGLRFRNGLSLELMGGYAAVSSTFSWSVESEFPTNRPRYPVTYALSDRVALQGAIVGGGVGYRARVSRFVHFVSRLSAGVIFATVSDGVAGEARGATDDAPLRVQTSSPSAQTTPLVILPEVGIELASGPLAFGVGLAGAFIPVSGPELTHGQIGVSPSSCTSQAAGAISCAPNSNALTEERPYGPFSLILPMLDATYTF